MGTDYVNNFITGILTDNVPLIEPTTTVTVTCGDGITYYVDMGEAVLTDHAYDYLYGKYEKLCDKMWVGENTNKDVQNIRCISFVPLPDKYKFGKKPTGAYRNLTFEEFIFYNKEKKPQCH